MPNPWDIPAWPEKGDDDENTLFSSIGSALSQWEELETQLAGLYSFFVSPGKQSIPAVRAYGVIATSRGRIEMLDTAVEAFYEDSEISSKLEIHSSFVFELTKLVRQLSGRRNEIAHGTILPYKYLCYMGLMGEERPGFCWVPPEYASNKHRTGPEPQLRSPKHVYN